MKRIISLLILLAGLLIVGRSFMPPRNPGEFDIVGFGKLPVLVNGRVKPIDTVARTSLLVLCNATYNDADQSHFILTPDKRELTPNEWLLDVLFNAAKADTYQVIVVDNPDLLTLLNLQREDGMAKRRFSFAQIEKGLPELERQARLAEPVEPQARTVFQRSVVQLQSNVVLYLRLKESLVSSDSQDFLGDLMEFQKSLPAGVEAMRAREAGKTYDAALTRKLIENGRRFDHMAQLGYLLAVPPARGESDDNGWRNSGNALMETFQTGQVSAPVMAFAGLAHTWRTGKATEFNEIVRLYRLELEKGFPTSLSKSDAEMRFNAIRPFYSASTLYVMAFFVAVISWLVWPIELGRAAAWLVGIAWLLTTAGILTRMWLEGRPPVTNLYSSALFVGWIAVGFCIALEYFYRNAIASATAGLVGFGTLLIAYYLSLGGDTLEMMRAVLDSNFWLGTHVVTVVAGYGATFLAGFLALVYIVMGVFTPWLKRVPTTAGAAAGRSQTNGKMLESMVYGIVCFATLFSLVGTILGGIWADQSWGRFWGWDPKENGALIIVIWNAIILHARWGGMIKSRGLMCLAVFGNIVTSWSWFGVNMLGVGLHTYGFMDAAFWWLLIFVGSQLAFIALANLPLPKWRSFRA
ncbi:MAG: cytochrome c assembly protein [Verrucomicrobia bacterium]|nr:cytochrome c assembly protein [Verrucomicrobiota bacterium]